MSCRSYKKECCIFPLIQPRKSAAIFSGVYTVHGAWGWCKHFVRFVLERRKKLEMGWGVEDIQQAMLTIAQTNRVCVCVSLSTFQCACVRVCQGPSEVQGSLQSHHSGKWRENTKGTPGHKSVCAPSLPLPLGEVIPPSRTSSSLPNFPLFALVLPSILFCGTGLWLCDSHPVTLCVCVLSSPVSLLWANLCQC